MVTTDNGASRKRGLTVAWGRLPRPALVLASTGSAALQSRGAHSGSPTSSPTSGGLMTISGRPSPRSHFTASIGKPSPQHPSLTGPALAGLAQGLEAQEEYQPGVVRTARWFTRWAGPISIPFT